MDNKTINTIVDIALRLVPDEVISLLASTIEGANTHDEICDATLNVVGADFGSKLTDLVIARYKQQQGM